MKDSHSHRSRFARVWMSVGMAGMLLLASLTACFADESSLPKKGLLLWLCADAGVLTKEGVVSVWQDAGSSGNHAQRDDAFSIRPENPRLIPAGTNGPALLRFDGSDVAFSFQRLTNILTVFWVVAKDPQCFGQNNERFMLGDSTGKDFHVGTHKTAFLLEQVESSVALRQGVVRINGTAVDPLTTDFPDGLAVISMVSTGPLSADQIGKDRQFKDRSWQGDIAEIILYNRVLPDAERAGIERLLEGKYGVAQSAPTAKPNPMDVTR